MSFYSQEGGRGSVQEGVSDWRGGLCLGGGLCLWRVSVQRGVSGGVCSVQGSLSRGVRLGGCALSRGSVRETPHGQRPPYAGKGRAIRILLECIVVLS